MGKTIRNTHIIGEAGVIAFAKYCNAHKPYIIFRETTKSDFGIDGEIELSHTNSDGKKEPSAEIIKVQIKSTESENSYIRNDSGSQFEFFPAKDDIEYWSKYKKYGIDVLLVIFDKKENKLYCKKITDVDLFSGKQTTNKNKNIPIIFDKVQNLLTEGTNDFTDKFSNSFSSRISFDTYETLSSNLLPYSRYPKTLYAYRAKFKTKKEIFKLITGDETPFFIIYNSIIYTFHEIQESLFKEFRGKILDRVTPDIYSFGVITADINLKRHYVELINEHLKRMLYDRKLSFNKDYGRYYFRIFPDKESFVEVKNKTRKRNIEKPKKVVTAHAYGKLSFYRHVAVELKTLFIEDKPYLVIIPKYLFTKDGKNTLAPDIITKYTNFLTARQYNNQYLDWLHFWKGFLFNGSNEWILIDYNSVKIAFMEYITFNVSFGIPTDKEMNKIKSENEVTESNQLAINL